MASIQVQGTLRNPLEELSGNTQIRIIAQANEGETLLTLPASVFTGADGGYNFSLVFGTHTIEVNFSKKYNLIGTITVDGSTPPLVTLPQLLNL